VREDSLFVTKSSLTLAEGTLHVASINLGHSYTHETSSDTYLQPNANSANESDHTNHRHPNSIAKTLSLLGLPRMGFFTPG
jgi:hypothetical protein